MSEHTPKHLGKVDHEVDSHVRALSETVGAILHRAESLGMHQADTYFSTDMNATAQFRLSGRPFENSSECDSPEFLYLVMNYATQNESGDWDKGQLFSEEYMIGRGGISLQVAQIELDEDGCFDHKLPDLPAIVWESQRGGLWTFRGRQGYVFPEMSEENTVDDIQTQHSIGLNILHLVNSLTPGCHDNQYPV